MARRVDWKAEDLKDQLVAKKLLLRCITIHPSETCSNNVTGYRTKNLGKSFYGGTLKIIGTKTIKELVLLDSSYLCEQSFPR